MSDDIFDRNIKAMKKWYPDFAETVENIRCNHKSEFELTNAESWDQEPIVIVNKDDKRFFLGGKRNVKQSIKWWSERLGEVHKYAPVVLVGLGSGNYLKSIVDLTDESVTIIAYEPSIELFMNLVSNVDLVKQIENRPIAFVVDGINGEGITSILGKLITAETLEFLKVEIHPNYSTIFPNEVKETLKKIQKITEMILVNYRSGNLFAQHMAKNQLTNMKYLCEGYHTKQLSTEIPHDGTAILVSAGPSLNDNIHLLKKAKNKAFILAVDSAVKPMLKAGIRPDAFVTLDAEKPLDRVDVPDIKSIPLIAPPTANSDILKQQTGKIFMCNDGYLLAIMTYMAAGKILPGIDTGGSVACNGFSLLYKVGFNTIILVGQDLAYTNNKSYADGVENEKEEEVDTEGMIKVKGNYEEEVPTLSNLKLYIDWFEEYIKGVKERRNVRVINATAGGAFIEGTELMSLEDAIVETCNQEVNYEELIEKIQPDITTEERQKMIEYLHNFPKELMTIKREAGSLYKEYHKILNQGKSEKIDSQAYLKSLKRIKKYTEKIESQVAFQLIRTSMPVADYIVRSESLYEQDSLEEEAIAIGKQGMKYTKMVQECANIIYEYAVETLMAIE